MTQVFLYGGPLKKDIIARAFGLCGQSVTDYALTPEEYDLGLQAMNDIAGALGITTFNLPPNGKGDAEDESGLPARDVLGFTVRLAQQIASNIGKTYMPNGLEAGAASALTARYQAVPSVTLGRGTIRGAGNRSARYPYFVTQTSDTEPGQ